MHAIPAFGLQKITLVESTEVDCVGCERKGLGWLHHWKSAVPGELMFRLVDGYLSVVRGVFQVFDVVLHRFSVQNCTSLDLLFQRVEGFVLDLPASSSTDCQLGNIRCIHLQLRDPTKPLFGASIRPCHSYCF